MLNFSLGFIVEDETIDWRACNSFIFIRAFQFYWFVSVYLEDLLLTQIISVNSFKFFALFH